MHVDLIQVPYDSGRRNVRMGRGPFHFMKNDAADLLRNAGIDVNEIVIESSANFRTEIGTGFELMGRVSKQVSDTAARGNFPLILAGNCNAAVGALSGLCPTETGLVWFDAHGDFNTPETSVSGFFDGMGLATLTGRCWNAMANRIPGFRPLDDEMVVLAGAREFDEAELRLLDTSKIKRINWEHVRKSDVKTAFGECLIHLKTMTEKVFAHIDMDVHDPELAPANHFPSPGGMRPNEIRDSLRLISGRFTLAGVSITAYDPECDRENKTLHAGLELIKSIGEIVKNHRA